MSTRQSTSRRLVRLRAVFAACLLAPPISTAQVRDLTDTKGYPPPARDWESELKTKIIAPFSFAAVGDLIITRPMAASADPGLREVINLLRSADVTVGNFESNLRDDRNSDTPVEFFIGSKEVAKSITEMGFDLVGRANNHAFDAGLDGMFETDRLLEAAGVVTAGSGRHLDEAREARFVETPKGRVGLVAMHNPQLDGRNPVQIFATRRIGSVGGRAGVNPLKLTRSIQLKPDAFAHLVQAKLAVQADAEQWNYPMTERGLDSREVEFFGVRFREGRRQGINDWVMDSQDLEEILTSIRNGKQSSHFLAAMLHTHQVESDFQRHGDTTPEFMVTLARAAIDNGADTFVGHGPHVLRGIEIYKGKPIFYGLGELFHQLYDSRFIATDRARVTDVERSVAFWDRLGSTASVTVEGLIAISRFEAGELREVRLYPTDAKYQATVVDTGVPALASLPYAREILARVQRLSEPFGTSIEIEGAVGIIRVPRSEQLKSTKR